MKRVKRHKVKTEAPETSTSNSKEHDVHDLAYYIHDRVELMHQVFSVLKYKELKAMVPACIRNISLDDLQELCTEELLGISSKRLCAILDGAEPPSDTESSSPSPPPDQMETISLDSISSDEEILSQSSNKKKKHKHGRHSSKSKAKRKKSKDDDDDDEADKSRASRAGLTVLELLELQARARAIRAQLQQEQQHKPVSETVSKEAHHSSDNEVEIKEEPAEVVEISSDEEKPDVEELHKKISQEKQPEPQQSTTVTKHINDLVITVPQITKQKIKLNRNKSITVTKKATNATNTQKTDNTDSVATNNKVATVQDKTDKVNEIKKDKAKKKKKHKKKVTKDDIDNDEITLQLSDTEKMDLLEDLDRKNYDSVSSCSSSSSESSSDSDVPKKAAKKPTDIRKEDENGKSSAEHTERGLKADAVQDIEETDAHKNENTDSSHENFTCTAETELNTSSTEKDVITDEVVTENVVTDPEKAEAISESGNIEAERSVEENTDSNQATEDTTPGKNEEILKDNESVEKDDEKNLSEGEISDRESSEIEAVELKPEVVCISDDEGNNKSKKKKKKKDKKSKKEKKTKKKSDFRESADQNFYKEDDKIHENSYGSKIGIDNSVLLDSSMNEAPSNNQPILPSIENIDNKNLDITTDKKQLQSTIDSAPSGDDDDIEEVYEILELSDDSSCCEVECTLLSKEPTALEIEALSAKIDEIERVEVITDKEIREYERREEFEEAENISWKDRYLDSKKVKKVLNTSNILNAIRKKNRDLKKKLAESKKNEEEDKPPEPEKKEEVQNVLEEGSIEQFNTLEALTKYVNPVKEVSKDLKKDAKLLLKMYKRLLKYNDMNKEVDSSRKKKKKKSKKVKNDLESKEDANNEIINSEIVDGGDKNVVIEGMSNEV